jgi:hypothetical protein
MKSKTFEPKTDTQRNLSPYQAERAEAQQTPVLRPDPLGATLAPPGSEATLRAHATSLNGVMAGPALRQLQRRYGNRYVQRVVELAQRRASGEGFTLDDETASRIIRARGGGQPLDGALQAQMGEALGHDFSGVRVHTSIEADALNQQLSARAFTTGHDIFFRQDEYNPGSGSGRGLIAHELSHVVQQSSGRVLGDGSGMTVRPAGDAFEREADAASKAATSANRAKRNNEDMRDVAWPDFARPADILALQRTVGNSAVQRLLAQHKTQKGGMDQSVLQRVYDIHQTQTLNPVSLAERQYGTQQLVDGRGEIRFPGISSCIGIVGVHGQEIRGVHLGMLGTAQEEMETPSSVHAEFVRKFIGNNQVRIFGEVEQWTNSEWPIHRDIYALLSRGAEKGPTGSGSYVATYETGQWIITKTD